MDATQSRMLNINIGILGHVDSGKTSLVKALSTSLSTASLDKSSQSQQRGITLDLGFSAFSMTIPPHLLEEAGDRYDNLQFTLVDCPGHASLIKTIIGGAQIIDMIVLVIDINKGIQTQTAECIVIGEITTEKMIIVLNKVDMIPLDDREERIEKMKNKLRKVFASTKFANPQFILTSAAVGGEKVAAVVPSTTGKDSSEGGGGGGKGSKGSKGSAVVPQVDTQGVDTLIAAIRSSIQMPRRNYEGPFYFAIDHCFPIKGHGTVLTGTILSGTIQINSTVELPLLQQQRKVKSMQMFRKPVKAARQGDRLGLCVANLDAKLVERGIATTPNSVPLLSTVICLVKKVRFFKFPCKSNTKFHITIGHTTVNASAVFFGKNEILEQLKEGKTTVGEMDSETAKNVGKQKEGTNMGDDSKEDTDSSQQCSLSASYHSDFPKLQFPWDQDFEYQDELEGAPVGDLNYGNEPFQWVLLQFQQPVYCPLGSLIIGSRLETIEGNDAFGGGSQHCRLSFYGPIISSMAVSKPRTAPLGGGQGKAVGPNPLEALRLYRWKQKECDIHRLIDVRGDRCLEAIGHNLYSKEAGHSIRAYLGMKLETAEGDLVGIILKAFGSTNKFRIRFPHGATNIKTGMKLFLRFKRYVYDSAKLMKQTGMELLIPPGVEDNSLGKENSLEFSDHVNSDEESGDESDAGVKLPNGDAAMEDNSIASPVTAATTPPVASKPKKTIGITLPPTLSTTAITSKLPPSSSALTIPVSDKSNPPKSSTSKPISIAKKSTDNPPTGNSTSSPQIMKRENRTIIMKKTSNAVSYASLNLSSLGQKRAVSSTTPSLSSQAVSQRPLSTRQAPASTRQQRKGNAPMSWATHLLSTSTSTSTTRKDTRSDDKHRAMDKSNNHSNNNSNNNYNNSDNRSNGNSDHSSLQGIGPTVKPGYQQHILEQMQATNPYLHTESPGEFKMPEVSPVSNLSYGYSAVPQAMPPLPPPTISPRINTIKKSVKNKAKKTNCDTGSVRTGTVESIKETSEGEYVAIVAGAFRMEESIRVYAGCSVRGTEGVVQGQLLGPFAKMGKCKVQFGGGEDDGEDVHLPAVKSKVVISLPSS